MIMCIFIGGVIGLLLLRGFYILGGCCWSVSDTLAWLCYIIGCGCLSVCIVVGGKVGAQIKNAAIKEYVASFQAVKATYEMSLSSETLSGLERIAILDTAIEKNSALAAKQASIDMWWNFGITEENKDLLLSLTPIQ